MAIKFIVMLLRPDHPLPVRGVSLLVNSLIHDSLAIRKVSQLASNDSSFTHILVQVAIFSMPQILQQLKRAHPMVPVDLATACEDYPLTHSLTPSLSLSQLVLLSLILSKCLLERDKITNGNQLLHTLLSLLT